MKTLVYANEFGTALTQHLGCTLINNNSNGDGFVTKVTDIQNVWDKIICENTVAPETDATVYGYTKLSYRMNNDTEFAKVMLEGAGVKLAPEPDLGMGVGILLWINEGSLLGKSLTMLDQYHLMNRDLGVSLPMPTGVVTLHCKDTEAAVTKLLPDVLRDHQDYSGFLSLSLRVTSREVYLADVHFGAKAGWFETARELLQGDLLTEGLVPSKNVAVGVLASVAPYPYDLETQDVELPKAALAHMAPMNLQKKSAKLTTEATLGYVTAWGGGLDAESRLSGQLCALLL